MNKNNFNLNLQGIAPVNFYLDAKLFKWDIINNFKNNTVIYMWFNKLTGQVYVGSALKGRIGLNSYCWPSAPTSNKNSLIYSSILKHGLVKPSVVILELCDVEGPIKKISYLYRESFYIIWAHKIYNGKVINNLNTAESSLGYNHTLVSKLIMRDLKIGIKNNMFGKKESCNLVSQGNKGRIHRLLCEETRIKISKAKWGSKHTEETLFKIGIMSKGRKHS